ncbi:MAG: hypothetical protein V1934_09115 [Methanobacteriota archaeon]
MDEKRKKEQPRLDHLEGTEKIFEKVMVAVPGGVPPPPPEKKKSKTEQP